MELQFSPMGSDEAFLEGNHKVPMLRVKINERLKDARGHCMSMILLDHEEIIYLCTPQRKVKIRVK